MTAPLLDVRDLSVSYVVRGRTGGAAKGSVSAVDGIDLQVFPGETLGLVGESGCGKSTTGRALLGRIPLSGGSIEFDGRDITDLGRREWRSLHRDIQLIFQDPYASLNPRRTVREIVGEPLKLHKVAKGAELDAKVDELLDMVRLPRSSASRHPHAFSGGQRQRIVIARALALRPRFVVADEPVSALDVSIQAQVVRLLKELQRDLGLSYLFIAHNLAVVRNIADRLAVMYLGQIVETGGKELIYGNPRHPYTQALLSAAPIPDPTAARPDRIRLQGDPPSAVNPPSGCRFHTRCPLAMDRCRHERPAMTEVDPGHHVACFAVSPIAEAPVTLTAAGSPQEEVAP